MPTTQVISGPSNSPGLDWPTLVGASVKVALASNDSDTSYIENTGAGSQDGINFEFSGIPASASIVSCSLGARVRSTAGNATDALKIASGVFDDSYDITESYATKNLSRSGLAIVGGEVTVPMVLTALKSDVRVTFVSCSLTYNSLPSAPTSMVPADGALLSTLTPTFTGTRVDDDDDDMTAVQIEVRRNSDDALMWSSGDLSGSGSTYSKAYAGTVLVNGTTYKYRGRTKEAAGYGAWSSYLTFTPSINADPTATLVSPIAGVQVGDLTPDLTLNFADTDTGTNGTFAAYQIQVRRVSDQVTMWDPGSVVTTTGQKSAKQAVVTYAGTVLVNGTAYEWRARVTDGFGGVSAYTAWASFTPQAAPNAPTLTSPSGVTNTLTPTIQGTYSQGNGSTETDFQYEIRQGGVTIYQSGDVTADISTGQVYGTANGSDTPSTPPALAWGTAYEVRARSEDALGAYSAWSSWQAFNTNSAPTTPTNLSPSGSITGDTTPALGWTHNDADGDAQTEAEIELRKVSDDSVVTGYGPKTLTQATLTHDVTETLTASPSTEYKWRVRTKGTSGPGFGPYSDWATFTVSTVPVLTVTEPDAGEVYPGPGHTTTWTFSGGSGTQQDYRVRIYASDQSTVIYDSGVLAGDDLTFAVPATSGMRNNTSYYERVNVRDTLSQESDSGFIAVSAVWAAPSTVTGLSVTAVGSQT